MQFGIARRGAVLAVVASLWLGLVAVPAVAVTVPVELSTAPACPVSLAVHWEPLGTPYPCYPQGTSYTFTAPAIDEPAVVRLNGTAIGAADGSTLAVASPLIGLNRLEVTSADGNRSFGAPTLFINYQQRLRLLTVVERKTPYALVVRDGTDIAALMADAGVGAAEWREQRMSSAATGTTFVVDLDAAQVQWLRAQLAVRTLVAERISTLAVAQSNPPWGLDRIDQETATLDNTYNYSRTGTGVDVFVVDSGLRMTHTDFTGRASNGAYLDVLGSVNDCNGHGTHVAGTVGGTTYGVAKGVRVRPVRVFDCFGGSTTSALIAAINWIIEQHVDTQAAVANFSLGGSLDTGLNAAIQALINDGVVTVVAAGNETDDACWYSPASATNAITVGATNINDRVGWYSNFGSCVDIFAPGTDVVSAGIENDADTATATGTSMATPHVAGVAALILERDFASYSNPLQANSLVLQTLITESTKNVIRTVDGTAQYTESVNRLVSTVSLQVLQQQSLVMAASDTDTVPGVQLPLAAAGGSGTGVVTFNRVTGDCVVSGIYVNAWMQTECVVTATKAGSTVSSTTYDIATSTPETFTVAARVNNGQWLQTATGHNFTCAIATTKRVYCWGTNSEGQIARPLGTTSTAAGDVIDTGTVSQIHPQPLLVTGLGGDVESVTAGYAHACAVMATGDAYCWGRNSDGQLGDSSTVTASTPVKVQLPETATRISAGFASTCAVLASGALACWGRGVEGQLGLGDTTTALRPQIVTSLGTGVTDVSVGVRHTCAVKAGDVYCWGDNTSGALGLGDTSTALSPETVTVLSGVSTVSAGNDNTCALLTSGATHCWGANTTGALMLGTLTQTETPTRAVGLAETSTAIAVGDGVTCGIGASGSAYCSGENGAGVLGSGDFVDTSTATAVLGLSTGVLRVAKPSATHACAIVTGGAMYCWGANAYGQLGTGSTVQWPFISAVTTLAVEPAFIPKYESATGTATGFVLNMTNYDSAFTYVESVTAETSTATISRANGVITVGSLLPGETASVSVMTSRVGFLTDTTTTTARALYSGIAPTLETVTATADGFTVQITNFDPAFSYMAAGTVNGVAGTVSNSGLVTVNGLPPATSDTVTVTSIRSGYTSETQTVTGTSLLARLLPTFGAPTSTADGFVVVITNYDTSFAWASTITSATGGTLSITGETLTVTGLAAGASATIQVTTTRAGHANGVATVTGTAIAPPPPPPAPTPPAGGGGGGGAAPSEPVVAAPAGGGGGGSASQIVQSGQEVTVDSTNSAATVTLQSTALDDITLVIPKAATPENAKVALTAVPRTATDPAGILAVRVRISDAAGRAITVFEPPLQLTLGKQDTATVVAFSADGETWTMIPRTDTDTLSAGQREGFRVDANGNVVVLTRHLTYFGFRALQPAVEITVAETLTVATSTTAAAAGGAGSGGIVWSTSSSTICTVGADGLVTAVAAGTCVITAQRLSDRLYVPSTIATRQLTIVVPPAPVVVSKPTSPLRVTSVGDRRTIRVALGIARAGQQVRVQTSTKSTAGYRTRVTLRLNSAGSATTVRMFADGTYLRITLGNTVIAKVRLR